MALKGKGILLSLAVIGLVGCGESSNRKDKRQAMPEPEAASVVVPVETAEVAAEDSSEDTELSKVQLSQTGTSGNDQKDTYEDPIPNPNDKMEKDGVIIEEGQWYPGYKETPLSKVPKAKPMKLFATSNPAAVADDKITQISNGLSREIYSFMNLLDPRVTSIQSVKFTNTGDAIVTVDTDDTGEVHMLKGLASGGSGVSSVLGVGLVKPKGLHLIEREGLLLVADVGDKTIKAYDVLGQAGSDPLFTISTGERSVWDVTYSDRLDTLFASGTDGVALAFDNFLTARGQNGADRKMTPMRFGQKISINLHGIAYDAGTDTLILTDVGSAQDPADGQIFTIAGGSFADGPQNPTIRIAGSETSLGNPVDIAYRGGHLYVAEKSNDMIMRYDDLMTLDANYNRGADDYRSFVKPESVAFTEK